MFNVTGGELVIILLLALMVLGPQRLPQAARTLGKVMAQIRDVSSSFQRELKDAFDDVADAGAKPPPRPQLTALDGGAAPPRAPAPADAADQPVDAEVPPAIADAAPEGLIAEPGADDVVVDAGPEVLAVEPTPRPVVDQEAGGRPGS